MKIFCVVTIGRQTEGEMISVRFEKAFRQATKAEAYAKELAKVFTETITAPQGAVEFYCERGVHEVELEDLEENAGNQSDAS